MNNGDDNHLLLNQLYKNTHTHTHICLNNFLFKQTNKQKTNEKLFNIETHDDDDCKKSFSQICN